MSVSGGGYNYPNQPLGNGALPPNSIMAPYAYISNSGGEIRTATLGEAPCRRFVISWENLPQTGCGANELITQVVLHETSNVVEMHIGQFQTCLGITACVGIQGGGTEGAFGPGGLRHGRVRARRSRVPLLAERRHPDAARLPDRR